MRVAIAGGGTGGHLFPGIAIAQELQTRGHDVIFIGSRGRIEEKKVPDYGFEIEFVKAGQVRGVGLFGAIKGLALTFLGVLQARKIIRRRKIDVVVGVGGYASVAAVTGAWLRGKPAALCEQNSVPGRANRLMAKIARAVFTAFTNAEKYLPAEKVELTGNPVRDEFIQQYENARAQKSVEGLSLFVFGGSQGARTLNHSTVDAAKIWEEADALPNILHQTGRIDYDDIVERYKNVKGEVDVRAFIDDMPSAFAKADLVLARAGAMTVTELSACSLPSILVPYPYAADDHQMTNAKALEELGGAVIVENADLTGQKLVALVQELTSDKEKLMQMGQKAKGFYKPDAAKTICNRIESIAKER